MIRYKRMLRAVVLLSAWGLATVAPTAAQEPIIVEGFSTPESALHDAEHDVYYVSNINGNPGDRDDNGFISRVAPDGTVLDLKWIDGASDDIELHAPKGMAVHGDNFYVTDINTLRVFERTTGEPRSHWPLAEATFLNDVTVTDDGVVYFTDTGIRITATGFEPTGTAAVWKLQAGSFPERITIPDDDRIGLPNGIAAVGPGFMLVRVDSAAPVMATSMDFPASMLSMAELPVSQLDGIVALSPDHLGFLISSFGENAIYHYVGADQRLVVADTPVADIGFDRQRSRVLIPQLETGRLVIHPVDLD